MLSTAGPTPSKNVGPQGIGNVCWKWQLAWTTRFNCGDAKTTVRPVNVGRFQIDCFPGAQTEFAPELEKLRALEKDGLLTLRGSEVELTRLGRIFVRNIATVFDAYLARDQQRFSRAV